MQHGEYTDDFDDFGPSRSFGMERDEGGEDGSADEEPARARKPRATARGRSLGTGEKRRDAGNPGADLMPMTRRDPRDSRDPVREARDLYQSSLDDMRNFLGERETPDPMHSVSGVAMTGIEIGIGAAGAAFLAQRFRQAGALIPVGLTLGVLGLVASQFNMFGKFSPDVRNISFGAGASALALWAAGRGIIANEATAAAASATAVLPPTPPVPPAPAGVTAGAPAGALGTFAAAPPFGAGGGVAVPVTGYARPAPQRPFPSLGSMPSVPQPMVAMSMSDFHDLVGSHAARRTHRSPR